MTKTFNISFPQELVKEVDRVAKRESMSRSEMIRMATRAYLDWTLQWKAIQNEGRARAKRLGIKPSDVERLVHEVRGVKLK